jgi:hypothetical protein
MQGDSSKEGCEVRTYFGLIRGGRNDNKSHSPELNIVTWRGLFAG